MLYNHFTLEKQQFRACHDIPDECTKNAWPQLYIAQTLTNEWVK